MRYLPILLIFCLSCSDPSIEEKTIADYEQTIFNSKIDLNFKMNRLEGIGTITAKDSLENIFNTAQTAIGTEYDNYQSFYDSLTATINSIKPQLDTLDLMMSKSESFADIMRKSNRWRAIQASKALVEEGGKILSEMDKYLGDTAKVLALKYECDYSIVNPMMGNAKQQVSNKIYYLTPDKLKVLGIENAK